MENRKLLGFLLRFVAFTIVCSASGCLGIPYQRPAVAFFQRPSIYFQPQQGGFGFQSQQGGFGFQPQFPYAGFGGGFARPAPAGIAQPGPVFLNQLQQGQLQQGQIQQGQLQQGQIQLGQLQQGQTNPTTLPVAAAQGQGQAQNTNTVGSWALAGNGNQSFGVASRSG